MELNDANLQTLTEFLRKTLDPDPTVRRPGNTTSCHNIDLHVLTQVLKKTALTDLFIHNLLEKSVPFCLSFFFPS